jgi:hypothetical protein
LIRETTRRSARRLSRAKSTNKVGSTDYDSVLAANDGGSIRRHLPLKSLVNFPLTRSYPHPYPQPRKGAEPKPRACLLQLLNARMQVEAAQASPRLFAV